METPSVQVRSNPLFGTVGDTAISESHLNPKFGFIDAQLTWRIDHSLIASLLKIPPVDHTLPRSDLDALMVEQVIRAFQPRRPVDVTWGRCGYPSDMVTDRHCDEVFRDGLSVTHPSVESLRKDVHHTVVNCDLYRYIRVSVEECR